MGDNWLAPCLDPSVGTVCCCGYDCKERPVVLNRQQPVTHPHNVMHGLHRHKHLCSEVVQVGCLAAGLASYDFGINVDARTIDSNEQER